MKNKHILTLGGFFIYLVLLAGPEALARTYTTTFPSTENPISEGGNWINGKTIGLVWSDVKTLNRFANGTQPGPSGYDDSSALLTGTWGSNQVVTAIIHTSKPSDVINKEVEIRLRSSIAANSCTGYEVIFSMRTNPATVYVQVVRWNGPLNNFTLLDSYPSVVLVEGDEVKATITNQTITAFINGVQKLKVTDGTYSSGKPGMGFYINGGSGVNDDFGFASFSASDGLDSPVLTSQPQTQVVNVSSNATFTTTATGGTPISYQWYFNNIDLIVGATNNQIILTDVQPSSAGLYRVQVSNPAGSVMSDNAELIMHSKPAPPIALRTVP